MNNNNNNEKFLELFTITPHERPVSCNMYIISCCHLYSVCTYLYITRNIINCTRLRWNWKLCSANGWFMYRFNIHIRDASPPRLQGRYLIGNKSQLFSSNTRVKFQRYNFFRQKITRINGVRINNSRLGRHEMILNGDWRRI